MTDEEVIDSDGEINETEHGNLLASVTQLEGKHRVKPSTRKEPSLEISEFHLVKSGTTNKDAVRIHELAQVLEKHTSHSQIAQKIRATKRTAKTLPKPLDKPEANRIDRTVRYENVKHQLSRWDAVVHSNRLSDHLTFPLNQPSVRLQSSAEFLKKFKPETPLEIEISKILAEGKPVAPDKEEESEFPLTLKEMMERREELMQLRAKQWSRESKAARQKKIKSKKYHRILRKEKIKEQLKEFEALKKSDPEAALERLEQLDKTRAEERASLRHRSTGHWARNRAVRAKYDKESRQVLAQQLSISRELTQKVRKEDTSDEEDDNEGPEGSVKLANNPWVDNAVTPSAEVSDFVNSYRKYWQNKTKDAMRGSKCVVGDVIEEDCTNHGGNYSDVVTTGNKFVVVDALEEDVGNDKSVGIGMANHVNERTTLVEDAAVANVSSRRKKLDATRSKVKRKREKELNVESTGNCSEILEEESCRKRYSSQKSKNGIAPSAVQKRKEKSDVKRRNSKKQSRLTEMGSDESNVVATTTGWTVVSLEKPSKPTSPKKQTKKKRLSSFSVDELFDDIDTKFQNKLSKRINNLKQKMHISSVNDFAPERSEDNKSESSLAFKKAISRPVIDEELNEGTDYIPSTTAGTMKPVPTLTAVDSQVTGVANNVPNEKQTIPDVDPNRFLTIKPKHLKSQLPDMCTAGEEALDDETENRITITEAFAEDDVVVEFRKEKEDTVNASKEKDITLDMPGWGQWGGKNLPTLPRRKKRMILKKPVEPQRKDSNKGDVIINEKKDEKLKDHLVNALPFPFTSVKSFEASIRAPIGNTWVPATSFWQLTTPEVETKLGAIIEPMDVNQLVNVGRKT